jgi:hypothetical protein
VPKTIDTGPAPSLPVAISVDLLLMSAFAIQRHGMARQGSKKLFGSLPLPRSSAASTSCLQTAIRRDGGGTVMPIPIGKDRPASGKLHAGKVDDGSCVRGDVDIQRRMKKGRRFLCGLIAFRAFLPARANSHSDANAAWAL